MNENEIAKIERRQLVSGGDLEQDYKDIRALIAEVRRLQARQATWLDTTMEQRVSLDRASKRIAELEARCKSERRAGMFDAIQIAGKWRGQGPNRADAIILDIRAAAERLK